MMYQILIRTENVDKSDRVDMENQLIVLLNRFGYSTYLSYDDEGVCLKIDEEGVDKID